MNSCARISALLIAAFLIAGCATPIASTSSTSCQVFKPLGWSKKDTRLTLRGIKAHNATGKALCGWRGK